ncbi:MAG: protein jag [Clostridia bacterium]|nr:protein jag [Clostridia bacterium]
MKRETVVQGKTVEEALQNALTELNTTEDRITYEVIEEPKKGLFGIGSAPAKIKAVYVYKPIEAAKEFINNFIADAGLEASLDVHDDGKNEAVFVIEGKDAGALIGRRGEQLDALQYLANLVANKKETKERDFTRITIDIENYRAKRDKNLKQLARKTAAKVEKTKRSIALEPMNAYERRIIHAEIQSVPGVSTNSVGAEGNRRVVVYLEGTPKPDENTYIPSEKRSGRRDDRRRGGRRSRDDRRKRGEASTEGKHTYQNAEYYEQYQAQKQTRARPEKVKDIDAYFAKLKEFSLSHRTDYGDKSDKKDDE